MDAIDPYSLMIKGLVTEMDENQQAIYEESMEKVEAILEPLVDDERWIAVLAITKFTLDKQKEVKAGE